MGSQRVLKMVCPPERHIPIEFREIYAVVKGRLSVAEREKFEEVSMLSACLYSQEYMIMKNNLKHNFLLFSVGAKGQNLQTRVGRGLPTKSDLDSREQLFVAGFLQLMAQARFTLLTQEEYNIAKAEQFLVNLPMEVNWAYYDKDLLEAFWSSSLERKELRKVLPFMADRVLVFHRGIGLAEHKGMFTEEKIDLLVEYLVVQPARRLWYWLRGKQPPKVVDTMTHKESQHSARKVVERRTLKRMLPTVLAVVKNFHKSLKLQEPAYKEVVVLYRAANKTHVQNKKLPAIQRPTEMRFADILARRNIHIKYFHDIPMADMDVIYADKKVYLKPLLLIQLAITVIGALVAGIAVLLNQKEKIDYNVLWSALSLVGARCGQVWSQAQSSRSKTIQDMVNILYDKTSDAQEGVLTMLMEDMAEQQLKEAILAYTLLLVREAEMTHGALDNECEEFLDKHFDLKIDFAVEDALPRLLDWGMVTHSGGKYRATPVAQAAEALKKRWNGAYHDLLKAAEPKQLPLSALLGDAGDVNDLPSQAALDAAAALPASASAMAAATAAGPSASAAAAADTPPRPSLTGAASVRHSPAQPAAHLANGSAHGAPSPKVSGGSAASSVAAAMATAASAAAANGHHSSTLKPAPSSTSPPGNGGALKATPSVSAPSATGKSVTFGTAQTANNGAVGVSVAPIAEKPAKRSWSLFSSKKKDKAA